MHLRIISREIFSCSCAGTGAGCGIIAGMVVYFVYLIFLLFELWLTAMLLRGLVQACRQCKKYLHNKQQTYQTHSITVEESDSGGYQVVE